MYWHDSIIISKEVDPQAISDVVSTLTELVPSSIHAGEYNDGGVGDQ